MKKTTKKTTKKKPAPKTKKIGNPYPPGQVIELAGLDRSASKSSATELSWAAFDRLVTGMAKSAAKFKPDAIVGVAHGGVFVGGALASAMAAEFFPVRISRRSRDQGGRTDPKLSGVMPKELKGRRVLIVDDIASSGDTLELATAHAKAIGAKAVATAALVCRPTGFQPDYFALQETTFYVFPWDYAPVVEAPHVGV